MDWTDRHCRYFHRLIAPRTRLYTEMVPTGAILYGDVERFLGHNEIEHPLALQLGGNDPYELQKAIKVAEPFGFDEINLNIGCPSDRVQNGRFGACLMAEPENVAEMATAMIEASRVPVSIKTRIGIDNSLVPDFLYDFVDIVAAAGVKNFIVHARKAWLQGLSPKENREIPPLEYATVYNLKKMFPNLTITINGGIQTPAAACTHLDDVDGVMIGREAYQRPMSLQAFEEAIFGPYPGDRLLDAHDVVEQMAHYAERCGVRGVPIHTIARHMLGIFQGRPGARAYRRYLSEHMHKTNAGPEILQKAAKFVSIEREAVLVGSQ